MVPKVDPQEKVGVFCRIDGKTTVIEYGDLPADLAAQRTEGGGLRFSAGSIAVHTISVAFVERLTKGESGLTLPLHAARRKVNFSLHGIG